MVHVFLQSIFISRNLPANGARYVFYCMHRFIVQVKVVFCFEHFVTLITTLVFVYSIVVSTDVYCEITLPQSLQEEFSCECTFLICAFNMKSLNCFEQYS